jgi:hypothetical protein
MGGSPFEGFDFEIQREREREREVTRMEWRVRKNGERGSVYLQYWGLK